MHRYLLRRLLIAVPILFGITVLSYFIMSLTPGDAVQMMISPTISQADIEIRRRALGLDQPVYVRYARWLGELAHGNLGYSFSSGAPVTKRVGERVLPTLTLTATALTMSYLIAVPIGVLVATRRYSWVDYVATFFAFLGISLPTFFLGLAGIYIFALRLQWLPVGGTLTLGTDGGLLDSVHHLILPASVLAVAGAGALTRYVRSSMLEVLRSDYIRTARAKGLAEPSVVSRHAFRNALIPVITVVGLQMGTLLSGAVLTESVFAWPGIGRLLVEGILTRDYPIVQAAVLVVALAFVLVNLFVDVLYAIVDPRIHYD